MAIYSKPVTNIKWNGEKTKAIPVKPGTRHGCPLSMYLLKIVLQVLARVRKQLKDIKRIQIGKDEVTVLLFADKMTVYISDPKKFYQGTQISDKYLQGCGWIQD